MAATVTGTFVIIDRATGPMRRMEEQAKRTDRAISGIGDKIDEVGTSRQTRAMDSVEDRLRSFDRTARKAGGPDGGISQFGDAIGEVTEKMDAASAGFFLFRGRMAVMASLLAAALPLVVDLAGALGALVGSLGRATKGAAAFAVGLSGALLVGLVGVAGAAIPASKRLGELGTAYGELTTAQDTYGRSSKEASEAAKQLADVQERLRKQGFAVGAAMGVLKEFQRFRESWTRRTMPGQRDFLATLADGLRTANRLLPAFANSSNRSMAAAREGVEQFLSRLEGPYFRRFLSRMTTSFERIAVPIADSFASIGEALGNIAVAVAPDVERLMRAMQETTLNWAEATRNTADLRRNLRPAIREVGDWYDLLKAVWGLTTAVFGSGADEGQGLVRDMTRRVNEYTEWVTSNPERMNEFWRDGIEGTKQLARFLGSLILPLRNLNDALQPIVRVFERLTTALNKVKVPGTEISGLTAALVGYGGLKIARNMGFGPGSISGMFGPMAPGSAKNPIATVSVGGGRGGSFSPVPTGGGGRGPESGRGGRLGGMFGRMRGAGAIGAVLGLLAAYDGFSRTEGGFGDRLLGGAAALDPAIMFEMLGMESPFTRTNPRTGLQEFRRGVDLDNPLTLALGPLALGTLGLQALLGSGDSTEQPSRQRGVRRPRIYENRYDDPNPRAEIRASKRAARAAIDEAAASQRARNDNRFRRGNISGVELLGMSREEYRNAKSTERISGSIRDTVTKNNDRIRDNTKKTWAQAAKAMGDSMRRAAREVREAQAKIYSDAYAQLTGPMGLSAAEARNALKGVPGASVGARPAGGGRSRGDFGRGNAYGGRLYAGGGRIDGHGHRDTVPLMLGMAAPGELVVNRHTEGRVNSMLGAFGTSLGDEVGSERVPHSGTPQPGQRGFKEPNAAYGARFRRGGRLRRSRGDFGRGGGGSIAAAGRLAQQMGLAVSGGPGYGGIPSSGHSPTSLHYQGLAYDVSGPSNLMRRYFFAALRSFRSSINELFYDPIGWYIDSGQRVPGAIGGHSDHVHIGFNGGGIQGGGGVSLPMGRRQMLRLQRQLSGLRGVPGATSQRVMDGMRGAVEGMVNGGGGVRTAGRGRLMGASVYGGPRDPSSGTQGYRGDSLPGQMAFAELGMGSAMGGLPYRAPARLSYKGRSVIARKMDIGAGGGPVKGRPRAIDLWHETAAALGFPFGTDLVKVQRMARGGRIGFGGWFGDGGSFTADRPTLIGVGERGKERVDITPAGKNGGGSREIRIGSIRIDNRREGDIAKQVKRELRQAFEEMEREIQGDGRGVV